MAQPHATREAGININVSKRLITAFMIAVIAIAVILALMFVTSTPVTQKIGKIQKASKEASIDSILQARAAEKGVVLSSEQIAHLKKSITESGQIDQVSKVQARWSENKAYNGEDMLSFYINGLPGEIAAFRRGNLHKN